MQLDSELLGHLFGLVCPALVQVLFEIHVVDPGDIPVRVVRAR